MTNEQTYIHLKSLRQRIVGALDTAHMLMPENAQRERAWKHIEVANPYHLVFCSRYDNPDHWTEAEDGEYSALMPLLSLLESIDDDMEMLEKAIKVQAR